MPADSESQSGIVARLDGYLGGRTYAIGAQETSRLRTEYGYESFHRERGLINDLVARGSRLIKPRALSLGDVDRWLQDSLITFQRFATDVPALQRAVHCSLWFVSSARPPDDDVWSGECLFKVGDEGSCPPITLLYTTTIASRLPDPFYEVAWQGAVDHFVGHLYPFYQNNDLATYDEMAACRNQHLAAQARARHRAGFRVAAALLPLIYRVHKNIPFRNYERLSHIAPA